MNASASSGGLKALLAQRNFRNLWLGQLVSQIGDGVTGLTVLIVINQLTGSTAAVAAMAIAITLPQLIFGLVAGVYVDRWDRKRIMIVSDVLRGIMVLGFLLVRRPEDVWIFYVVGFAQAAVGTLFIPAKSALLPAIVGGEHLLAANGLSQMTAVVTTVAGGALAGLLVGVFGSAPAFCFDALTFFGSALFVARIVVAHEPAPSGTDHRIAAVFAELKEGLRFLFGDRVLSGALLTFAMTMLGAGAVNVLFVPFLVNVLKVPTQALGSVPGAQVLGMIVGSALVTLLASRFKTNILIGGGVALLGTVIFAIGAAPNVWYVLLALFAAGVCTTPVQAAIATLLQVRVPDDKRGRAGSVMNTALTLASVISMAFSGVLANAIGVRQVFFVAGCLVTLTGVVSALMMNAREPRVRAGT